MNFLFCNISVTINKAHFQEDKTLPGNLLSISENLILELSLLF